jgi:hypothetical protein
MSNSETSRSSSPNRCHLQAQQRLRTALDVGLQVTSDRARSIALGRGL